MLTSLDFLNPGQTWPPASEKERLQLYENNRALFECEHAEKYKEQFKRIERVIGNFNQIISYAVILNYQKLISLKTADLLLGEPPKIIAGDSNSGQQKAIDKIQENSDLINTAYMTAIDVSRYGDGLFLIYKDADTGVGKIDVTQPGIWFPVVSPDNLKKIQFHVLAWTYSVGSGNNKKTYLKCHIHNKGSYEEREYLLEGSMIKSLTKGPLIFNTGLTDFAVVPVSNTITSDRVHGIDDYTDIDSIISELEVRVSQVAKILDKHAAPSVTGPTCCVEQDPETGEWHLKMGNFFPRDNAEDPKVEYITWEANLEANFNMIDKLINILYTISEMGSAIFGDMFTKTGQVPSGSALKRLMISPLAKVNRIRMRFDPALKKAIKLCSQLGGKDIVNLTDVPISITWQDGLPGDPKEEAEIMATRTGQKATMSVKRALKTYDGMSDEDADTEIEAIDEDEAKANPFATPPFSQNNTNQGDE